MVSTRGRGVALIWDMEKGKYKRVLKGHKGRVLGLAQPKGEGLWTIGADDTLRCWGLEEQE